MSSRPAARAAWRAIRDRLKRAKTEGDLPTDADPAALARYLATVIEGMAVQAAGGASRKELAGRRDGAARLSRLASPWNGWNAYRRRCST